MKRLPIIVLVGALVIAAEGACTFNKWDFLDMAFPSSTI